MAQADQTIQNATFPAVRADINNNLAALFTDSSGSTAPSVTVAFQDWIDTSGANPLWKKRNAANNAWITLGTLTSSAIAFEGTLPSQTGNAGEYLTTNGTVASWAALAIGATLQVFTASGTYTPTAGKSSFFVIATGGGGGGGGGTSSSGGGPVSGQGGGGAGTGMRMYDSAEMGVSASITIGAGGSGGGTSVSGSSGGSTEVNPNGSGLTLTAEGGGGGSRANTSGGGAGGNATNAQVTAAGTRGFSSETGSSGFELGGFSFFVAGNGSGGRGGTANTGPGETGNAGVVLILEF